MRSSDTRQELMKECKEKAMKAFAEEYALIHQLDKVYYEMLQRMPAIRPQSRQQGANYALAIRSYRALHSALDIMESGYFEISLTVFRSVYENYVQMNYFATFPEEAKAWLDNHKKFDQSSMRKKLDIKGDFYKMLSQDYTHPHEVDSLLPLVFGVSQDGVMSLNHYPVFDPAYSKLCLRVWLSLADKVIVQVQRVYSAEIVPNKHWVIQVASIQKLVRQYIQAVRSSGE